MISFGLGMDIFEMSWEIFLHPFLEYNNEEKFAYKLLQHEWYCLDLSSCLHVVSNVEFSSVFHALLGILQGLTFLRYFIYLKIN